MDIGTLDLRLGSAKRRVAALGHNGSPALRSTSPLISLARLALSLAVILHLTLGVTRSLVAGPITWYFLPTGQEPRPEIAKLIPEYNFGLNGWQKVSLPHHFDAAQPDDNVFGWYVTVVEIPSHFGRHGQFAAMAALMTEGDHAEAKEAQAEPADYLPGHDLALDLGLIDDSDVTYVNGRRVGGMGSFTAKGDSVWPLHRRYRVPTPLVRYGRPNVIAVQVKDFEGVGGFLGQPAIGAVLASADGHWGFKFGEGDPKWAAADFDDSDWSKVQVPDLGFKERMPDTAAYAWYRLRFAAPENIRAKPPLLDLGPVYDVCEVYLNGKHIGTVGQMPPDLMPVPATRARVLIPEGLLRESNLLAVRVYCSLSPVPEGTDNSPAFARTRQQGGAGLPWYPAYDLLAPPSLEAAREAGPAALLDFADLSFRANDLATAAQTIEELRGCKLSGWQAAMCLDREVRLACLKGEAARAKPLFAKFVKDYPRHSLTLATTYRLHYALCDTEPLSRDVHWLGEDRETAGNWRPRYGSYGYILCAWSYRKDITSLRWPGPPFSKSRPGRTRYSVRVTDDSDYARAWVGAVETKDPRVLCVGRGDATFRRAAVWDDHGEIRPFDGRGPDLWIRLETPGTRENVFRLSFYLLDYDWYNGEHPRVQSIVLLDADTLSPLAIAPTGRFGEGVYQVFCVRGARKLVARVSKHISPCAVVSGIFLDEVRGPADRSSPCGCLAKKQ